MADARARLPLPQPVVRLPRGRGGAAWRGAAGVRCFGERRGCRCGTGKGGGGCGGGGPVGAAAGRLFSWGPQRGGGSPGEDPGGGPAGGLFGEGGYGGGDLAPNIL